MQKIIIFCVGFIVGYLSSVIRRFYKNRLERLASVKKSIDDIERSERGKTNIINTITDLTGTDERAIRTIEEIINRTEQNNQKSKN